MGDLSCTKVNGVNRLQVGVESELQAIRRGSSSSGSQASTLCAVGQGPTVCCVLRELVARQMDQHKQMRLSRLVNVCKPSGLKKDTGSAVFLRCLSSCLIVSIPGTWFGKRLPLLRAGSLI